MVEAIRSILGSAPDGYAWLEYVVFAIILLFVVKVVIDVFFGIFRAVMKW